MRLFSHRLTWHGFRFENYKRARNLVAAPSLDTINTPSIPGLVSIVLPVYNDSRFLSEALESVLAQSHPEFELIIVDDGSTDQTPEIINRYAITDQRIRVITQNNQRLPRALSNGFKVARGEFLTWTSSDNRMKVDFLAKLVECLRAHPDWDMVYANIDVIDERGEPLKGAPWYAGYLDPPDSEHVKLPADTSDLNMLANNYIGSAFMYRDRVNYLLGDYSQHRFGTEDYDYWMRVNALLNLRHADFSEPIYDYRFHPGSLTSRDSELGITRSRQRLMIFENFRQDFYLTPLMWFIDGEDGDVAGPVLNAIRKWARSNGHLLLDRRDLEDEHYPRLWFPAVYLKIISDIDDAALPPDMQTHQSWDALLLTSRDSLPEKVHSGWDICITSRTDIKLPYLDRPRQGWLSIPDVDQLCTTIDIQTRSSHLAKIEAEIEKHHQATCKLSVVICTYQRGDKLVNALQSVLNQSICEDDYEIIVVNNDPSDTSVDDLIASIKNRRGDNHPDHLRLVRCPFKGLSYARNAGISEARGEVVCFLDDDALASFDWLENIWAEFDGNAHVGVVGGKITLQVPEPRPRWLKPGWEKFWSEFTPAYNNSTPVNDWWQMPWGANWSARRRALLGIGGFRSGYGRYGKDFGGAEETVAALLIQRLGYRVVVAPSVQITHAPELDRFTFEHVWRTIHAGKRNEYAMFNQLYIEATTKTRLKSLLRNIARNILTAFTKRGIYLHQRMEHCLYAMGDFRSLLRLGADVIRRYRRPSKVRSSTTDLRRKRYHSNQADQSAHFQA